MKGMVFVTPGAIVRPEEDLYEEDVPGQDENYFVEKVVELNASRFRVFGIDKELRRQVQGLLEDKLKKDEDEIQRIINRPEFARKFLPKPEELASIIRTTRTRGKLYTIDERYLLVDHVDGTFHILGDEKKDVEGIGDWLANEITEISHITKDFNLSLDKLDLGRDFADGEISEIENSVSRKELPSKNGFEVEVGERIATITNAMISNVEISFAKPAETQEYDILVPITREFILDVEAKDYETVKEEAHKTNETLKQKIIFGPADKAERIGATPFVVTKGFPPEALSPLQEIATSRKVNLYDAGTYHKEIEGIVLRQVFGELGPSMYPTQRSVRAGLRAGFSRDE